MADLNYEMLHVTAESSDERSALLNLLERDLGLTHTIPSTYTWSNTRGSTSHIDYILYRVPHQETWDMQVIEESDRVLDSDHRLVTLCVGLCRGRRKRQRQHRTKCGKWLVDYTKAVPLLNDMAVNADLGARALVEADFLDVARREVVQKRAAAKKGWGNWPRVGGLQAFYRQKYAPEEPAKLTSPMHLYDTTVGDRMPGPPLITREELEYVLTLTKSGKSCGNDAVPYEFWSAVLQSEACEHLLEFLNDILLGTVELPVNWTLSQIVLLPKTREPREPKEYRPIVLAATLSKLFTKALLLRLRTVFPRMGSGQLSSQVGAQALDGSVALKHVIHLSRQWGLPLLACKLDIQAAFDTLSHESVSLSFANVTWRQKVGRWPNAAYSLTLLWRRCKLAHDPPAWELAAANRQRWREFTLEVFQIKNLLPDSFYPNLHQVDLCHRCLLRTGDRFWLLPQTHPPIDPPYQSSYQVTENSECQDEVSCFCVACDGSKKGRKLGGGVAIMPLYGEVPQDVVVCGYPFQGAPFTNIRAELLAAIKAVEECLQILDKFPGAAVILITDSAYVLQVLEGGAVGFAHVSLQAGLCMLWHKCRGRVRAKHVHSHKGHALNEIADKAAKEALDHPPSRNFVRRMDYSQAYMPRTDEPGPPPECFW
ncbi:unnamed protein product [Symbiodinium sp. CCMP2592]|nr:unnamed protein product [Symbiodinium sp. CCMP2592]